MNDRLRVIAIDGPAGAGKSSVARLVAEKLGCFYLDTGMMYRAVTADLLARGLDPAEGEALNSYLRNLKIEFQKGRILINGTDRTEEIRSRKVTMRVSAVSALPVLRKVLVKVQREIASGTDIVMDGRDIGTVVLPDAPYKFYLDASLEERAARRLCELDLSEEEFPKICQEIKERDLHDSERHVSPLRRADDAIYIDTTRLTLDEVVACILESVQEKLKAGT